MVKQFIYFGDNKHLLPQLSPPFPLLLSFLILPQQLAVSISIASQLFSPNSCHYCLLLILLMSNPNLDHLKTIKCPFNAAHVMPYDRFLSHLQKCQFPNKKAYRSCKYNSYHVFHLDVLNSHENKCPDRKKYEQEDDDWGVSDEPNMSYQMKEEKSIASHSTSFSAASFNSYKSQSNSKPKGKQKQPQKKVINNSQYIAQDLDEFNPQE